MLQPLPRWIGFVDACCLLRAARFPPPLYTRPSKPILALGAVNRSRLGAGSVGAGWRFVLKRVALAMKVASLIALAVPLFTLRAQTPSCSDVEYTPAVVIPGGQPKVFYFCKSKGSATSTVSDVPVHLRNAGSLTIVVKGINPLVRSFTVSINGTQYAEVSGSSLMSLLSIPSPAAQSPSGGPGALSKGTLPVSLVSDLTKGGQGKTETPPGPAAKPTCSDQYAATETRVNKLRNQVSDLVTLANLYRDKVNTAQTAYLQAISTLEKETNKEGTHPTQSDFLPVANGLDLVSAQNLSIVPSVSADDANQFSDLAPFVGKAYTDIATSISAQALQLGTLKAPENCDSDAAAVQQQASADNSFLQTLSSPAGAANSKMDQLIAQVNGTAAAAATLAANIASLQQIAMDPQNFEIDLRIPPEDRIQTAVVVTVSWTNKLLPSCVSSQSTQGSGPVSGSGGAPQGQKATAQSAGCSTPTSDSRTFTAGFGQGPRTFESAGLVFSPLRQPTFTTAAAGSSAECPSMSADKTTTYQGCIVKDTGDRWRILPIGLATLRITDVSTECYQCRTLIPNYFSFGATIKSNSSSGTSLEFLTGLSWTSPGHHVFATAGGYAGEVTRLAGGLSVGPQTTAPPATLPTASSYRWGFGFAISYTFGSQGGNGGQSQSPPTPAGSQPSAQPKPSGTTPPQG